MKKAISMFMTFAMILVSGISVKAAEVGEPYSEVSVSASVEQRVFNELVEGHITNEEDVIRVALEQYQERKASARAKNNGADEVDNSFSITQTLGQHKSADGDTIQHLFTTNLLIVDKSNAAFVTPRSVDSGAINLSNYQIYAYMSVDYTRNISNQTAKINWFTTTLSYGTSMRAASLHQECKYVSEPFASEVIDATQTFYSPSAGSYKCTSGNGSMISFARLGCGVSCLSAISAGTQTARLAFKCTNNAPSGAWDSEYV